MVPVGVFLQELQKPSNSKALTKTSKAAESSQETPPPIESIYESPDVMESDSEWHTPFMIHLRTGGLPEEKNKHN
jgi:hypothetical protein